MRDPHRVLLPADSTCYPPYCTSSEHDIYPIPHFDATTLNWVWTPYDCYHHFYNMNDITRCAKETQSPWLWVVGDSQGSHD